ncbi:glycosyltransferase [Sphingomonas sp. BK345]|uniref:glycosyltransferase n=1 Tax=Sphingomonas sp. BK345 TaxID=2586980 RepID=UPI001611B35F|nr:glycosyltransferase [Sphingomonas sp. BK345]MBB3474109.1 glycosyltransferase involved in cell wall biosynthesis [Sphingomonas sp. BK345]
MRVLLVSRNYFPAPEVRGGAQVSVAQLATALQARGHAVAVLSVDDRAHEGVHAATGVSEYRLRLRNLYARGEQSAPRRLAWHLIDRLGDTMASDYCRVLRAFRPDVVNTHVMAGIGTAIWRVAAAERVPIVHRVSDYYLMCLNSGHRRGGANCAGVCRDCRALALAPSRRRTGLVQEIIYVSDRIAATHSAATVFPRATPHTILAGGYRPRHPLPVRPDLLDPPRVTLGYFGRLSPEKGVEALLLALRAMPTAHWRLRIGGTGVPAYVERLRAAAGDLPVTFLGVGEADEFYATVDAVIVPSLWDEPSGRVAFEAGIHGAIPIVSARGGLPEMVGQGTRGLIVEPAEPETIRAAVARVRDDAALRRAIRARWAVDRRDYDPDTVAARTLAIYEKVVGARL